MTIKATAGKLKNSYETSDLLVILIFAYLAVTILWSDSYDKGVYALFEYRVFPIIFICGFLFRSQRKSWELPLAVFSAGCLISLLVSYALYYDLLVIEEKLGARSRGDRIFHGLIMVSFIFVLMTDSVRTFVPHHKFWCLIKWILIALAGYNIFAIEIGRTAYLTFVLAVLFTGFVRSKRAFALTVLALPFFIVLAYFWFPNFSMRIDETVEQSLAYFNSGNVLNSPGIRLELYFWSLQAIQESPFWGYGIGDVQSVLKAGYVEGGLRLNADNVHSEYLNFALIGGVPLAIGLLACFVYWVFVGMRAGRAASEYYVFPTLLVIFSGHMLLNSAIKDLGDKTLLTIVLIAFLISLNTSRSPDAMDETS